MKRHTLFAFAVLLGLAGSCSLSAQSIPLSNPSFESPAVSVGAQTVGGIPGWQYFPAAPNCIATAGVAHPLSSQLSPPSDGSQVGYSHLCPNTPGPNTGAAFFQTLPVNYQPNTTYTFTLDFYRDAGATLPIRAAIAFCFGSPGNPICPDPEDTQDVPAAGGTVSVSMLVNSVDRFLGSPISVGIFQGDAAGTPNLYFDNARLEAVPRTAHSYGIVGMYAHRPGVTSRLNAVCSPATTSPCDLALEFHDIHGVLVAQTETILRPGQTASLDQPVSRDFMPDAGELIPRWFLKSGMADVSFEILDSSMRTNFFVNWADGSVSKMGNLNSGPVGITAADTVRAKVYCDGSVRPGIAASASTCRATLGFTDTVSGRVLKQSRVMLAPGTGGYLDLNYEDTPQTSPRQEVIPQLTVTGGNAVGGFAVLDRATGGTVTQSFPAILATTGGGGGEN